jgi:very-short-patch-repair endonuclease
MAKVSLPANEILKKYEAGASLYELAEQYSTYPNKILRLLRKITVIRPKSEAQKGAYKRGRKVAPMLGRVRSEEEKLKIAEGLEDFYQKMGKREYNKIVARARKNWKKIPKDQRELMIKRSAESNRKAAKEGSSIEKFLKLILEENGYLVEFHKKNLKQTKLEVDIFLPKEHVAIEIDGPTHYKNIWGEEALAKQIKYDNEKNGILLSIGLVLIRVKCLRSKLNLGAKNRLKNELIKKLQDIRAKFPDEKDRLVEIEI